VTSALGIGENVDRVDLALVLAIVRPLWSGERVAHDVASFDGDEVQL
jgi:hypothetical protein